MVALASHGFDCGVLRELQCGVGGASWLALTDHCGVALGDGVVEISGQGYQVEGIMTRTLVEDITQRVLSPGY